MATISNLVGLFLSSSCGVLISGEYGVPGDEISGSNRVEKFEDISSSATAKETKLDVGYVKELFVMESWGVSVDLGPSNEMGSGKRMVW